MTGITGHFSNLMHGGMSYGGGSQPAKKTPSILIKLEGLESEGSCNMDGYCGFEVLTDYNYKIFRNYDPISVGTIYIPGDVCISPFIISIRPSRESAIADYLMTYKEIKKITINEVTKIAGKNCTIKEIILETCHILWMEHPQQSNNNQIVAALSFDNFKMDDFVVNPAGELKGTQHAVDFSASKSVTQ